jgi:hypothetical protein
MKQIFKILIPVAFVMFFTACDDFLTYSPSDAVGDTEAFNNAKDVENALNGVYYTLGKYQFYGRDVLALGDIAADNTWVTGSTGHFDQIYKYTVDTDSPDLLDIWEYGYETVDYATKLIKAGKTLLASDLPESEKTSIKASMSQAYALRALAHFTLVNVFGLPYSETNKNTPGIIVVEEEPVVAFQKVQRTTVEDAYNQVLKDIASAKENITLAGKDVFHFNPAALAALEARVQLYKGDWAGAITAAQEAITLRAGALVMNPANYVAMWNEIAPTSEDLFTIGKTTDDNLSANSLNTLYDAYGGRATSGLIALFAPNDMRLGLFGEGSGDQIRALKFNGLQASRATSNVPVFRLPEMYLILAEAKAQLGQADAVEFVFEVAKRNPDLLKSQIPTDKAGLLHFISMERRRELFQEGHRWFDLRRTGERMTRVGGSFGITNWSASQFVYPVPAKEINASGIVQNENWNAALPK